MAEVIMLTICLYYSSRETLKAEFAWVVNLVVSGRVAKLELGRLPIRQNGGKGKFVTLAVSRIRHFTYATTGHPKLRLFVS